jgi:hypothetical protein
MMTAATGLECFLFPRGWFFFSAIEATLCEYPGVESTHNSLITLSTSAKLFASASLFS